MSSILQFIHCPGNCVDFPHTELLLYVSGNKCVNVVITHVFVQHVEIAKAYYIKCILIIKDEKTFHIVFIPLSNTSDNLKSYRTVILPLFLRLNKL